MKLPELLIPAGNLEKLHTALLYGADAVYVGVEGLSLRGGQAEMNPGQLSAGVKAAHQKGVKVYAALNVFARNHDLELAEKAIPQLREMEIDALILSDPGFLALVKRIAPEMNIHLSTQANVTNIAAARFWLKQGVRRINLARELNLAEIRAITAAVPEMEFEIFIHGAMCMAYSGRCFLSALRTGRSSNHGECTHPCRWEYQFHESTRPGQPFILEEDGRYSYLLSSKDLCLIEHLPEILNAGVAGLKVEGRMKSAYYVAVVTRTYRAALEAFRKDPAGYQCAPEWLEELKKISNRGYTTGFYLSDLEKIGEMNPEVKYLQTHDLAGIVMDAGPSREKILVGVRNQVTGEDYLELLLPNRMSNVILDPARMTDEHGLPVNKAHNGYQVYFPVNQEVPVGAVIRRRL
ncbi:MAG: U32 family peptidase [Firmicutes bacterium]|nr:U32 family peptidase [Bacillota bacterium]